MKPAFGRRRLVPAIPFLIFLFTTLLAQDGQEWRRQTYEQGLLQLSIHQYRKADSLFHSLADKNSKLPQAYYGMGLVQAAQNPKSDKARKLFQKAVHLDKAFGEAYFQIALIYYARNQSIQKVRDNLRLAIKYDPEMNDAWKMLLDIESSFMQTSSVFRAYAKVIMQHPDMPSLYDNFVEMGLFQSDYKATEKVLNELLLHDPNNGKYQFDLARVYYLRGDYQKSLDLIQNIKTEDINFSATQLYLYTAYNYFEEKKEQTGLDYYWSAVNSISDSADAALVFNDVCFIMKDDEYDWLQTLPIDSLPRFYHRFWRARDPNPATRDNERLLEHYRRYAYAQRACRRFAKPKKAIQYSDFRRFRDYDEVKDFDQTGVNSVYDSINAYGIVSFYNYALRNVLISDEIYKMLHLPKAIPIDRKFVEMGLTIIRHGTPDVKIAAPGRMKIPACYSFKYFATPQRPEMIFHFLHYPQTGWMFTSMPVDMTGCWELGPDYARMENLFTNFEALNVRISGMPGDAEAQAAMLANQVGVDLQKISRETVKGIQAGLETDSYVMNGDPLFYPHQIVRSKGVSGRTKIELFYAVHGSQFALANSDSGKMVNVHKPLNFFSKKWDALYHFDQNELFHVSFDTAEWSHRGLVDLNVFDVKPGQYVLEMQMTDNTTKRTGVYRDTFIIPNFSYSLLASDILLSGAFQPASGATIFNRGDIDYSPHMFTPYAAGEQIGVYVEVYNLTPDNAGKTRFRVTCTLQAPGADENQHLELIDVGKKLFKGDRAAIGTTFEYEGKNMDDQVYLNLDVGKKRSGEYDLVFQIEDLNSGKITKQSTQVFLQ